MLYYIETCDTLLRIVTFLPTGKPDLPHGNLGPLPILRRTKSESLPIKRCVAEKERKNKAYTGKLNSQKSKMSIGKFMNAEGTKVVLGGMD